jgi:photosystem II stability/assembly factor-like uncharacterized protein
MCPSYVARSFSIARALALSMVVVTSATVSMTGPPAAASVTLKAPYVAPGTLLTDTTLGAGTTFGDVDMLSNSLGYAVAAPVNHGRGWYYLVQTHDLGDSWSVRAALPVPPFVGTYGWGNAPTIDFLNAKVGYLSLFDGPLWVSVDGGLVWSKVVTPGIDPTFAVGGDRTAVVSAVCHRATPVYPSRCPSKLTLYLLGVATPYLTVSLPVAGVGPWRAGYVLALVSPSTVLVVQGRGTPRSALLETINSGATWRRLRNPCGQLNINQLLLEKGGRWLLSCFGDGGMNQGTTELWDSSDGGRSWSELAHASEEGLNRGGIGDVSNTLYDGDRGLLFAALGGAAGGVEYSTDGGSNWSRSNVALNIYGGAPETMSTFGASGAVVSAQNFATYRTLDASTWTQLPTLPAGPFEGLSVCTAKATTAVLGRSVSGIPSSSHDFAVTFTNKGRAACYLNGVPQVQPVLGTSRTPVGRVSFQETANKRGGFVVLRAKGGQASIALEVQSHASYSRSYCRPATIDGFEVRFNAPAAFYLSTRVWSICRSISTTGVEGITAGVVNWR